MRGGSKGISGLLVVFFKGLATTFFNFVSGVFDNHLCSPDHSEFQLKMSGPGNFAQIKDSCCEKHE